MIEPIDKEIVIKEVAGDDILEIIEIEKKSFKDPWTKTKFLQELYNPDSIFLGSYLKNEICGYIIADYIVDEVNIYNLCVKEEFRNKGIGTKLLKSALEISKQKKFRKVFLEVKSDNLVAKKIYESLGFKEIGIRKKYYFNGRDAFVMMLELKNTDEI